MVDEEAVARALERVEHRGVSAGEDIFSTMHGVCQDIETTIAKFKDGDEVAADDVGPVEPGGVVSKVRHLVSDGNLVKRLEALTDRLDLVMGELRKPAREDLLKLLEDPLSSETRNTRRNVGALSVLALLVGFAGKAPDSFVGFGISTFKGWEFPVLLSLVVSYEFVAFKLYIRNDVARRKIHYENARHDHGVLVANLARFNGLRKPFSPILLRAREIPQGDVAADAVLSLFDAVAAQWKHEVEAFESEFRMQDVRSGWDVRVPNFLFFVSLVSLLSVLRVCWPRLAAWLAS